MPSLGGAIHRARAAVLAEVRAECDAADAAARPAVEAAYAEMRARRRLRGDALRDAVVEALSFASEADPVDRVRVHVVETGRGTLGDASACLSGLSHDDWCAVTSARANWRAVEGVPVRPAVVLGDCGATAAGRRMLARLDARQAASEGRIVPIPGRGRDRVRVLHLLDAVCAHRSAGGTGGDWVRWCVDRGLSRGAAYRWWARSAAWA